MSDRAQEASVEGASCRSRGVHLILLYFLIQLPDVFMRLDQLLLQFTYAHNSYAIHKLL